MIYLSKPSSFDIKFDNLNHDLILGEGLKYDEVLEGTLDYIRPCLLNTELDVPIHLYRVYQNLQKISDESAAENVQFAYDLMLMPPNVTGVEYVKTHGHQTPFASGRSFNYPVIVEILYGVGTFLLQKFNEEFDPLLAVAPEVKEVYISKVQKGSKIIIPPGFHYTLINTRGTYLATGRLHYKWKQESLRSKLEGKQGMCYYIIRKNARQEVVRNPRYKETPKLQKLRSEQTTKLINFRSSKPLSELLSKNPEKFSFLEKPWEHKWELTV